jgi:hypothetical protein
VTNLAQALRGEDHSVLKASSIGGEIATAAMFEQSQHTKKGRYK